jgi:xylulokinase
VSAAPPLVLALDVGTGSVRAHLLDTEGHRLASAGRSVPVALGADARAELDPDQLWAAARAVLGEALAHTSARPLAALAVASGLGYLLLDQAGSPLGPALLWMDRRAHAEAARLTSLLPAEQWYRLTGRAVDPEVFLAKLSWIRTHEPERFRRTRCFVGIKDDLIRRLTGEIASDPTHAAYTMLFDVGRRDWSDDLLRAAGIPRAILPPLRGASTVAGRVSRAAAEATGLPEGLPVVTGASDGTVACLAAGIAAAGTAVNVTGTSDVLMIGVDRPVWDPEHRTLVNPHPLGAGWMVGGILGTTGGAVKWFADRFCPDRQGPERYAILDQEAARAGPGAQGLLCLTGLAGERAPLWDPLARGALVGLDLGHRRGEVVRAILEGVALDLRAVVALLGEIGAEVRRIRVVGGGAVSDLWSQIRADAIGLPVERPRLAEGTATGLLLLAGLAVGLWTDLGEAARRIAPTERTFEPDPGRHALYERLARVRRQTYEGLRDVFPTLADLRSGVAAEPKSRGAEEQQKPEPPQSTLAPPLLRPSAPLRPRSALNVYLCGMIGSGKSAIGERLAARMGRPFLDQDREMDRELGRSFHDLVREQGWLAFRELEYQLCRRFASLEGTVVALGGGAVRYGWNVDVLRGTGVMVLLEADLAVLARRVRAADRPRVNPGVSLEEDLQRIWSTARHLYRGAADLVYRTDGGETLEGEVEELLALLLARGIR